MGPEFYCCGHNECCTNVMTMWYFWFALLIGIVLTFLLVCKYNSRMSNNDLLPVLWPPTPPPTAKSTNDHYMYKPLRYNDDYLVI
jgi:hypothetical protein